MRIVDDKVFLIQVDRKVNFEQALVYIQVMYTHAYKEKASRIVEKSRNSLTPNEERLANLLVERSSSWGIMEPVIVFEGLNSYLFGYNDEYSGVLYAPQINF